MRKWNAIASLLTLLTLVSLAVAQAKPTRVVLTLVDGKTVSGEFIEATPAGVTLKPNPKAEPVLTPWQRIKRASNGMTHAQVVAEWQKTRAGDLCEPCKGSGATTCPTCVGTNVDPSQKTTCEKCEGAGSTGKCKTANCVEGMIPCPDKCLKRESFSGVPDAEGKRWRQFRGKGGFSMRVSDAHVGQRVVVIDGTPELIQAPCPTCAGTTRVKDASCKGSGKTICVACKGHGVTGPECAACEGGHVKCETCGGTGLKTPG